LTGWKQNACSLRYINCGIEVLTDGRVITRVRGDKAHPHTAGYICQKAQRLPFYGNHADRLTSPLRRRPDGVNPLLQCPLPGKDRRFLGERKDVRIADHPHLGRRRRL
jgi:anaerobic selenocysteine-containing dehydrogenase